VALYHCETCNKTVALRKKGKAVPSCPCGGTLAALPLISQTYRLYPTQEQEKTLRDWMAWCAMLYNRCLALKNENWGAIRSLPPAERLEKQLPWDVLDAQIKSARERVPAIAAIPSEITREVVGQIKAAFKGYFESLKAWKNAGANPNKKPKPPHEIHAHEYRRLDCWQSDRIRLHYTHGRCGTLDIGKCRDLRIRIHRVIEGMPRAVTIRLEPDGWYARISFAVAHYKKYKIRTNEIGINLGARNLIARTDGLKVAAPIEHWLKIGKKIARWDRVMARRKRGSKRWIKAKEARQKVFQHLDRSKTHFHGVHAHRTTRSFGKIVIEHMELAIMIEASGGIKHRITGVKARTLATAAIGRFVRQLEWKCKERERILDKQPSVDSTRTCSACGHVNPIIPLHVRTMKCEKCGHTEDREFNAAKNNLARSRLVGEKT
jgi:putative transposase